MGWILLAVAFGLAIYVVNHQTDRWAELPPDRSGPRPASSDQTAEPRPAANGLQPQGSDPAADPPAEPPLCEEARPPELPARPAAGQATLKRKRVLNRTESRFYRNLLRVLPEGYWALPQVRLVDLFEITAEAEEVRQEALWKLAAKHVDFAIVKIATMRCACVVEIDGPCHLTPEQRYRDAVKDRALEAAGIPLVRLPARYYPPKEVQQLLNQILHGGPVSEVAAARMRQSRAWRSAATAGMVPRAVPRPVPSLFSPISGGRPGALRPRPARRDPEAPLPPSGG